MNSSPKWILLVTALALASCRSSTVAPLGALPPNNGNVILAHAQGGVVHEAPPHIFSPRSHVPRVRSDPSAPNLTALPKMIARLDQCYSGTPTVAHGGVGTIAKNTPTPTPTPTYKPVLYKSGSGTKLPPPPASLEARSGVGTPGAPVDLPSSPKARPSQFDNKIPSAPVKPKPIMPFIYYDRENAGGLSPSDGVVGSGNAGGWQDPFLRRRNVKAAEPPPEPPTSKRERRKESRKAKKAAKVAAKLAATAEAEYEKAMAEYEKAMVAYAASVKASVIPPEAAPAPAPAPEQPPSEDDQYDDWGQATYLSNDDTMSLSSAQRVIFAIEKSLPVPLAHIRPHELLNYFSFETAAVQPTDDFSMLAEVTEDPKQEGSYSLALAIRGRAVDKQARRNANLTFVVDRSGSMRDEGRMKYLKRGMRRMLAELKTGDLVNVVLFDHKVCAPLENFVVGRDDPDVLEKAIDRIKPRGATDVHAGLTRGYALADRAHQPTYNNRVVLVTDALANTGDTDPQTMAMVAKFYDERKIRLSGVGVGTEFNDVLLDKLTERGKGAYVFLGSEAEVDAVFGSRFISLLETTAMDVHLQLHLPPSLRMNVFYGEESSVVKEDVQSIHYFADTSQLFLSDLMARGGKLRPQDQIMLTIEYEDPETGAEMVEERAFTLGEIAQEDPFNVRKSRLLIGWADRLARLATRPAPAIHGVVTGIRDPDGWQACDTGRTDLAALAQGLSDPESARVLALWDKFCSRYERPSNPVGPVPAGARSSCDSGTCVNPSSCEALKRSQPNAPDGVYDLDPDGAGPRPAFRGYCDMRTDGGGWTLAMRFAPSNGQFHFYSQHWTTNSLVNANTTAPTDRSDGKFPAYNELVGGEIRGCLQHPQTKAYGCKRYSLPKTTTLLDLFTNTPIGSDLSGKGLYFVEPQADSLQWLTILGRERADIEGPVNYTAVGINIDDDQTCFDARVRFGLGLNNEANSVSLNDTAGFGAQSAFTLACDLAPGADSGWRTASGLQTGSKSFSTAGHIWIR